MVWEKQKQLNIGLDLGLLEKPREVCIDYFTINNEDLQLCSVRFLRMTGFTYAISKM